MKKKYLNVFAEEILRKGHMNAIQYICKLKVSMKMSENFSPNMN